MSHPLYNPFASGNQNSSQRRYGLSSLPAERDPPRASSHLGHGSSLSSTGPSSAIPANSRGTIPSLMSQSVNYRPEQSRVIMDEDIARSINMHINSAREEVRLLNKPIHQPVDQGTRFTATQRDEFRPSGRQMASYPMSSASAPEGHRRLDEESSSLDWLSNYKRTTADDSKFYSSSHSSNYASGDDGRFNAPSERDHEMQSFPGLHDYDCTVPDRPASSTESSRPKYTSESAANILLHFGLEKEDLEHLISFPEDQITPANLPFILRQVCVQKAKGATTAVPLNPYHEPQPTRNRGGMDSHSLSTSGEADMCQEEMSSVVRPSKVIDYGHTGKYTGRVGDEIERTSGSRADSGGGGSMLLMDTYDSSRHSRQLQQKNTTEVKSSALGSSREQASSVSSLSSSYSSALNSVVPPTRDQTKRLQTQPNQTFQTILSSFSLPKKDTDIRVVKSEASKPVPLKEPEAARQSTLKTHWDEVHPNRPDLVRIGSNRTSGKKDQRKPRGQGSMGAKRMKKQQPIQKQQQMQQQTRKQPKNRRQQQSKQQTQQTPNQTVSQTGQSISPAFFSAAKSVPPAPFLSSVAGASLAMQQPLFIRGDPRPVGVPPARHQPIPSLMNFHSLTVPTSKRQPQATVAVSKGLPTAAMMHDYAAASPRIFPHTCSLCNKECTQMKDWLSHQNTSLHLDNCKLLRTRHPEWDGEIPHGPSAAVTDASSSASTKTSQHRHQRTRHGSRSSSRSPSPCRHRSPEGRRKKRRSRSRSPHSSRYTRRSRSRSRSPRYDRPTSSRYQSLSTSPERRSSPRRRDDKRSSPRRTNERRSSPRRSRERRSSPRRSHEGRSSTERSSPQQKKSSSAERLAKKLLKTSAVQSLSKQSDLEAVVKTLAPALLAELAKMKSSSSSAAKESTSKPSKGKPSLQKSESGKTAPPTMVRLAGIQSCLSHGDVTAAVEHFGKTKSVVLFRSRLQAVVCFEKEEDAQKLKSIKSLHAKGIEISVVREKETVSKEQEKPPKKKPATSSVSTPQSSESKTTTSTEKVLPPTASRPQLKGPSPSEAKKATTGKLTSQKVAAKGSVKGLMTVAKSKVLVSKAKSISTKQIAKAVKTEKLPAKGGVKKAAVKKKLSSGSKSTAPEHQPEADDSEQKPVPGKTSVKESVEAQKETAEGDEAANVKSFEPQHQVNVATGSDAGGAEPMELGETGAAEAVPESSADKPSESPPPTSSEETRPTEASVRASPHVQQSTLSEPESTAQGPETKTDASQMQQPAAVEAKLPDGGVETRTVKEDPEAAVKTETDEPSANEPTAAAASTPSLTVGEMVEKHLHQNRIACLNIRTCFSPKFFGLDKKLLFINGLPRYDDGCYTEDDVANLLIPFGFKYTDESLYVVPQTCMAFARMPSVEKMHSVVSVKKGIVFKGSKIRVHVVASGITMTPFGFYKSLMKLMKSPVLDDGTRTFFIKNISPSEIRDLREALKKIDFVRNYLPLLNKVFVEFESVRDADRLGVWYSLLKQAPGCEVHRLNIPYSTCTSLPPRLPAYALPDSKDAVAGATIPSVEFGVPQGSISPFWVTMRKSPFLFPTVSPWFIIPDYLTVRGKDNIQEAGRRGSMFSTIMLTGLPEGNYEHEDVARLVWKYFPKQSLHSLFYSVVVLPLQRRAFVFFANWTSCCNFVQDHIKKPLFVKASKLSVHFVLQAMNPGSSEEVMYRSLMKWSNAGVPESESLEERLLCVEISEASVNVIRMVMEAVASIATFVSFLPLANRICVEMADSSGVTQVVEKYNTFTPDSHKKRETWSKVQRFETLKNLKQRLQEASEITINFEPNAIDVEAKPPVVRSQPQPLPSELSDNGSQPGLQTSGPGGSTMSESITAGPSAAALSDVSMEEDHEKSGTEIVMGSAVGPEPNDDVEGSRTTLISAADLTSAVSSRKTVPAASSPAPSATAFMPKEDFAELPQMDTETLKVLTAAVRQHRLSQTSKSHSEREGLDDFTDDTLPSDTDLFDEQNFNMDDFVTVDEVGEDVEDTRSRPERSSSSSSRARRERQSSHVSSGSKETSKRSSKDSKSAASSSSSSSKLTKSSSSSNSSSVKKTKSEGTSEPSKLPTKPSSSAKPSSSSPPSTKATSLPGQKTQESKTKSPSKASRSTSSGCSTLSSSTTREREKITSAATVEASVETHLKPLKEEAKATEGAVTRSDHRVSAEGIAAKTVEPEIKVETSSEMHPPPQGHGVELSQGQNLEIDCNVNTLKDRKKSKEEIKEEDVDKHTEEQEDDGENYQILDSLDDQTDEQMEDGDQEGSSETQQTGPERGQTLHEESYEDLDSADNKGHARPEKYSEMEMDGSFQVLDSVTENKEASSQEDIRMVQDDGSPAKQVSDEGAAPVDDKSNDKIAIKDAVDKDQETNDKDHFQVLDTGSKQAPRVKGDRKKTNQKEEEVEGKILAVESCKASKDVEAADVRVPNEDQPQKRTKKEEATARKVPTKRSGPTTTSSKKQDRTVKKYETRKKMDTTASQKDKDSEEATEETVYQIVDSVGDEPVQDTTSTERSGRRRSARGKKEDEIEDETTDDDPTVPTKSTRGKRERTSKKDALIEETVKEDTPTRRRQTPAREAQEGNREKTGKKEEKAPSKHSTPTKKSDGVVRQEAATNEMFDSVEDEVVKDDRPTAGRKRGRPKKEVKTTKKDIGTLKKDNKEAYETVGDEEEVTYQILDSVEDKTIEDQPSSRQSESSRREDISKNDEEQTKNSASLSGSTKNEEEEDEPMYQIVDSLEDDQDELTATETSDGGGKEKRHETPTKEEAEKGGTPTPDTTDVEPSETVTIKEESLYQRVDDLVEVHDDPSAAEESGTRSKERTSKTDIQKEDESTSKSQRDAVTTEEEKKEKSPEKNDTTSTLVNLDQVSEEEEDYPDDTAEEEELRKRQAATNKKQFAEEQEARRTGEGEERERKQSSRSSSSRGGDSGGTRKESGRENEEVVEVDTTELLTLDEVGADEAREEGVQESQGWGGEITEGELETLVTLDEFVEKEEDRKAQQDAQETRPLSREDQSVDSLNPKTSDKAAGDEEEKPDEEQAEKTSRSVKRKHDEDTEESVNFVTVDEVGEEEEKEAGTTRIRGRPKKRTRPTPVRKSTRGKKVSTNGETEEEKEPADVLPPASLDASSSPDKDSSTPSSDGHLETQKKEAEVEAASRAGVDAASAERELRPETPDNQTLDGCVEEGEEEKEGWSRTDTKAVSKQRRELVGPEAKRSRSQSPCVAADFKLPPFKPNTPLGQEFVVPRSGYFCNLCSVFYLNESNAKELHCSSRRHYESLQKHCQKLQQKPATSSHDSVSD
ncbi:zinc finger protein 638-like isoform X2 [Chelmon rostratus]|uniref:zinc finger protein 638-like isoform X2 n=1 Tax=Chelmon rostratus TaxID=109905 RepID=UPI001BEC009C|nr:zinc finger protein 638-like isoform X2 [Chelmon rostratus]